MILILNINRKSPILELKLKYLKLAGVHQSVTIVCMSEKIDKIYCCDVCSEYPSEYQTLEIYRYGVLFEFYIHKV